MNLARTASRAFGREDGTSGASVGRRLPSAGALCAGALLLLVLASIVAPVFLPDPAAQDVAHVLQPPGTPGHLLGTEELGRDELANVMVGLRTSIMVSGLATLIAAIVGTALGLWAGFGARYIDEIIMRAADIQLSVPGIVLALLVVSLLRPSFWSVVGVLALSAWVVFSRQVRSQSLALRESELIMALTGIGMSRSRLLWRHVVPSIGGPCITLATLELARLLLAEAALGYLGMDVPPPQPTLGAMISSGQAVLTAGIWWPVMVPGVAIALLVLLVNTLGDWMRDKLDPHSRAKVGGR